MRIDVRDRLDYRMSFAAERTYLAYLRTGLALLAAGVAVAAGLPGAGAQRLRQGLGGLLVLLGVTSVAGAYRQLRQVNAAMLRGEPLPASWLTALLGGGLVLVGIGALVVVALS